MAYSITYLIDLPGTEFNQLLSPSRRADDAYFLSKAGSPVSDLWEGKLPANETEILVDLTGAWTLCMLPFAYSTLMDRNAAPATFDQIKNWEIELRSLIPDKQVLRVDDFLLEPWNSRHDHLLVRDPQAFNQLALWLQTQDERSWTAIPTSHRP